jgi:hypothetical protein
VLFIRTISCLEGKGAQFGEGLQGLIALNRRGEGCSYVPNWVVTSTRTLVQHSKASIRNILREIIRIRFLLEHISQPNNFQKVEVRTFRPEVIWVKGYLPLSLRWVWSNWSWERERNPWKILSLFRSGSPTSSQRIYADNRKDYYNTHHPNSSKTTSRTTYLQAQTRAPPHDATLASGCLEIWPVFCVIGREEHPIQNPCRVGTIHVNADK